MPMSSKPCRSAGWVSGVLVGLNTSRSACTLIFCRWVPRDVVFERNVQEFNELLQH
jgi:hypothetical protein